MWTENDIPLFPLGVVLLPETVMPLHIFEQRYKVMIGECIEQGKAFGVVYLRDSKIQRIGCSARITDVLKRYEDGRLDILTKGERRFLITSLDESRPFLQAGVRYVEDHAEDSEENLLQLRTRAVESLKRLNRFMGKQGRDEPPVEADDTLVSFYIAGDESFTPDEQQEFLEMTSPASRFERVIEWLQKKIEILEAREEISKIIRGNGKTRDGLRL